MLTRRWVEPIGGVTYQKIIGDWGGMGLAFKAGCIPHPLLFLICFLQCGERFACSSASFLLALAIQQAHQRPTDLCLSEDGLEPLETGTQSKLFFSLYIYCVKCFASGPSLPNTNEETRKE